MIDIHAHVMTPEAEEIAAPLFSPDKDPFIGYSGPASEAYNREHIPEILPRLTRPDVRLRDMDRMGVDVQAISVVPPQYFYWAEPQVGAKLSGMVNDRLFEIVRSASRPVRRSRHAAPPGRGPRARVSSSGSSKTSDSAVWRSART